MALLNAVLAICTVGFATSVDAASSPSATSRERRYGASAGLFSSATVTACSAESAPSGRDTGFASRSACSTRAGSSAGRL